MKKKERFRSLDSILGKACGRSNVLLTQRASQGVTNVMIFSKCVLVSPSNSLKPLWGLGEWDDQSYVCVPSKPQINYHGEYFLYGDSYMRNNL